MISTRGSVPNPGAGGGGPGARTALRIFRGDGRVEEVGMQAPGVEISGDDRFEFRGPTGGGFGDPLARPPDLVACDVCDGWMTVEDAARLYGVVCDDSGSVDLEQTEAQRRDRRREGLERAEPPCRPMDGATASPDGGVPLFPGIVQVGDRAVSEPSGAVLAVAPDHWTDGCCTLDEISVAGNGFVVTTRAYLDPLTGQRLFDEVLLPGGTRSFACSPDRWTGRARAEL
jgi:N-methylhydantoinase B